MHNACEQKNTSNHTPAPFQLSRSLIHSFIHSNFRSPCLIFLHSRQWLRFIYADSFLMFRFVPNFESTKVKKANERCVFGLYSFLSLFVNFSLFFVCQPSEYAAQNKHKFIYTHTFTCKHKWKWPQRYAHFNAHEEKSILIHATHSFAFLCLFLSASSFSGHSILVLCFSIRSVCASLNF